MLRSPRNRTEPKDAKCHRKAAKHEVGHRQGRHLRPAARIRHQESVRQSRLDRIAVPQRLAGRHRLRARPAGSLRHRHGRRLREATRNAGFVNLHSGAGVGNALGNIYTAHRNQTPLVITAGQQARSILPLQPFLYAERASEFPRPYVKFSVEPARPEDVPAAIARAYYVAMQPPCGPTFVSVPIDDWTHADQFRSRPAISAANSAPTPAR